MMVGDVNSIFKRDYRLVSSNVKEAFVLKLLISKAQCVVFFFFIWQPRTCCCGAKLALILKRTGNRSLATFKNVNLLQFANAGTFKPN